MKKREHLEDLMRKIILYYSRSGTSKRVAERIGKALGVEVVSVDDRNNYNGVFGYLKGGFYASRWRKVDYSFDTKSSIDEYTHVYLVGPIWASRTAPAIYSFLMDNDLKKKSLVLTNDGTSPDKSFSKMEEKFGKFERKYAITKCKKNEDEIIKRIIQEAAW